MYVTFLSAQQNLTRIRALTLALSVLLKLPPNCVIHFLLTPLFPPNKRPDEVQEAGAVLLKAPQE